MTTLKSLPARPSLESLRKQAKKLARHIAGGNAEAIVRARTQLPNAELPLSHRDAQLVLAAGVRHSSGCASTYRTTKRSVYFGRSRRTPAIPLPSPIRV